MLYRTLKRMIERGNTEGMEEKLDIFFAADKLTREEYTELTGLLTAGPVCKGGDPICETAGILMLCGAMWRPTAVPGWSCAKLPDWPYW